MGIRDERSVKEILAIAILVIVVLIFVYLIVNHLSNQEINY
ncbi:MAG: hypothetical protein ACW97Z_11285 [Candidatus Hodarchaeales archaeon]|jgi:hypothetical protein